MVMDPRRLDPRKSLAVIRSSISSTSSGNDATRQSKKTFVFSMSVESSSCSSRLSVTRPTTPRFAARMMSPTCLAPRMFGFGPVTLSCSISMRSLSRACFKTSGIDRFTTLRLSNRTFTAWVMPSALSATSKNICSYACGRLST